MRKVVAVITWAWIPFLWNPLWGQTPGVGLKERGRQEDVTANSGRQPATDLRGTKDVPLVIDTEGHKDTPSEAENKQREKDVKDSIDSRTVLSAEIAAGATVVLMVAGIGGVSAALRTLNAILRQVDLQDRIMQQWVDYGNWRTEYVIIDGQQVLRISLDIVNPTSFPVILPSSEIRFEMDGVEQTCKAAPNCGLLPNKPQRITVTFSMGKNCVAEFFCGSGVVIHINGTLDHVGSIGKLCNQKFKGLVWCRDGLEPRYQEDIEQSSEGQT